MKRLTLFFLIALACIGIGRAAYRAAMPPQVPLSRFVPAGSLLYLEAKDFHSLLNDWNASPQKKQWLQSDNYEVFSRSRLFLRLKGASDQFAAAAGLPPDMDFLSQVAGEQSALAIYDIGKLQFLYVTYLPSARSMQSKLWQTRAQFEPRTAGGQNFYLRRDPESQREVAFAIAGDYLFLATREDLVAEALQLMSGRPGRAVETESWWMQSTQAAGEAGDLRMVLDLQSLVPNGYFRTYWVQQNITDLSQYSAATSDLFRTGKQYREERVLIRKKDPEHAPSAEALAAAADLSRLVPDDAGLYASTASPTAASVFAMLETKVLAPHSGVAPAKQFAPEVQLTTGEQGSSSDLETRIDTAPAANPGTRTTSALQKLLDETSLLASLQIQSTQRDNAQVFVRIHSAVALEATSNWNAGEVKSAITEFIRPALTASVLGAGWLQKSGYEQLDGLWPLAISVRGRLLVVSDDPTLMESVLMNVARKSDRKPADLIAGFRHDRERENFGRLTGFIDRPNARIGNGQVGRREPQFFSGSIASLSSTLSDVSAEQIEVRSEGNRVRQTVRYEWFR